MEDETMPLSKAHKEQTRRRVVQTAARAFRTHGISGVGVAEVMRQAGLTQGGFYAHFASKDALVAAACAEGFQESSSPLLAAMKEAEPGAAVPTYIRGYLSRSHRDHPDTGCVIASLGQEIVRGSPEARHAFTHAMESYISKLAQYAEGDTEEAREDAMYVLVSGVAGALLMSRAVNDPALSDRILRAARRFYLSASAGTSPSRPEVQPPAGS
jgi:TetR/AcrR family transcriptional repressor of nem operon